MVLGNANPEQHDKLQRSYMFVAMGATRGIEINKLFPSRPKPFFGNDISCGRMETIFILFP
jgi:hypothetical protein